MNECGPLSSPPKAAAGSRAVGTEYEDEVPASWTIALLAAVDVETRIRKSIYISILGPSFTHTCRKGESNCNSPHARRLHDAFVKTGVLLGWLFTASTRLRRPARW